MSKKWYGSLINRIEEGHSVPNIVVGMGATRYGWSDRYPYEVIEVTDEKHIVVRELGYKRIDDNGMSECQEYEFFSKEDGNKVHLVLRNGQWRGRKWEFKCELDEKGECIPETDEEVIRKTCRCVKGKWVLTNKLDKYAKWSIGRADRYYDFSF